MKFVYYLIVWKTHMRTQTNEEEWFSVVSLLLAQIQVVVFFVTLMQIRDALIPACAKNDGLR